MKRVNAKFRIVRNGRAVDVSVSGRNFADAHRTGRAILGRAGYRVAKRRANVAAGFYDDAGIFHPIRASFDYSPRRAGELRQGKKGKSKKGKRKRKK